MKQHWRIATFFSWQPGRRLALVLLLLCLVSCESMLFYPLKPLVRTPTDINLDYQDVFIELSPEVLLHGWWLPAEGDVKGTVYFLHGNAENISTHIASVYWLPAQGYQVLLLDYRGFGRSTGKPHIPEIFQDVIAGFNWLQSRDEVAGKPVILFGQSIGAALAAYSLSVVPPMQTPVTHVVLDSGFARYSLAAKDAAASHWLTWLFQYPVALSMPRGYDLVDSVQSLTSVKLLIMHSVDDQIVDFKHAGQVFAAAPEPKQLLTYKGRHISGLNDENNRRLFMHFIAN